MKYRRMPIEIEAPEEIGYGNIRHNLAESSMRDIKLGLLGIDWNEQILFYGDHRGRPDLKSLIVEGSAVLTPADVLVTAGAATALFVVATTLLSEGDHLVVIRPNYGTNLETPRAIGCAMTIVDLTFETGFQLPVEAIRSAILPETKMISLTSPHNPTGVVFSEKAIQEIIELASSRGIRVLMDETYRYLNFQTALPAYAAEQNANVISICSLSKAFGAPGIRMGWLINRDPKLMHQLLAAKEQIMISNSVIDEAIAAEIMKQRKTLLDKFHSHLRANFAITQRWMKVHPHLEWVEPVAGAVGFPRIRSGVRVNLEPLYKQLLEIRQTMVGPGHWFEQDDRHFRLGFGYPEQDELTGGLRHIDECLQQNLVR
ncbi:MAG: pyridoxal phosphate-dependent aminotransferase [Cyclobacteriaceae bacterium]|nr:pyridoxal phosphate-dependent aminotransferase [Cyclobacteriaceae bacterium]